MLHLEDTTLLVIDVQEKLFRTMYRKEKLAENLHKLIRGIRVLEIPVIFTEQNPAGLGPTLPEIASLVSDFSPIPKLSFSCCGEKKFNEAFKALDREQVLITGIEAHVCVYQTALEMLDSGYEVQVVTDAISSRTPENIDIALERVKAEGGSVTSVEMALFELLKAAGGDKFKEMLKIVK